MLRERLLAEKEERSRGQQSLWESCRRGRYAGRVIEDLKVWQGGCDLAVDVYEAFRDSREYAFRDQMIRSSLSVPSNVAEGSERGTDVDFVRFLHYSKGSAGELRTQAHVAARVGVPSKDQAHQIIEESRELGAMLQGFIGSLRQGS